MTKTEQAIIASIFTFFAAGAKETLDHKAQTDLREMCYSPSEDVRHGANNTLIDHGWPGCER